MKRIILILINLIILVSISYAESYRVIEDRLKVCARPDSRYEFGYLTKGYEIKSLEKYDEDWSYINEGKIHGYIKNDGIRLISEQIAKKENNYSMIIGLGVGLIAFILILYAIYGERKPKNIPQYSQNPLLENTTYIYKSKSTAVAIILTMLFGPFGMLYSTIRGALTMILLPIVLIIATIFAFGSENAFLKVILASSSIIFFILYWFICVIWGAVAASNSIKVKQM